MIDPVIIGDCTLYHGDNRDVLRQLPDNSICSCVTDPPYALQSIVKRFANSPRSAATENTENPYGRTGRGFMGMRWDVGEVSFSEEFWREVYRVLKPGGHVAAFGASRGYHRMACAIEDAGFEIRDSLAWLYATGFPKSHNVSGNEKFCQCGAEQAAECNVRPMRCADVSSSINDSNECGKVLQPVLSEQDTHCGREKEKAGRDTAHDGCPKPVVERRSDIPAPSRQLRAGEICSLPAGVDRDGTQGRLCDGASFSHGAQNRAAPDTNGMRASSGSQAAAQRRNEPRTLAGQSFAQNGRAWQDCGRCGKPMVPDGLGTALKPAFEPIVLARKPLSEGTVAANVLRWGTGALNIDGCRVGTADNLNGGAYSKNTATDGVSGSMAGPLQNAIDKEFVQPTGRWPANVVHDGSDEVVGAFPSTGPAKRGVRDPNGSMGYHGGAGGLPGVVSGHSDNGGSAARFFYSAKASKADRAGSKHPTVKPIALMEWLATLITPPGGTILDPFAGSGTTGAAARNKGFNVILCEREDEYVEDIKRRMALPVAAAVAAQPANDNSPCPDAGRYDQGECCGGACLTETQLDIFGRAA